MRGGAFPGQVINTNLAEYTTLSEAALEISRIFSSDGAKKRDEWVRNGAFWVSYPKILIWQFWVKEGIDSKVILCTPPHPHSAANCMKEMRSFQ